MSDKLTSEEREKLTVLLKAAEASPAYAYAARAAYRSARYAAAYAAVYKDASKGSDEYKELLSAYEDTSTYTAGAEVLKEGLTTTDEGQR